MKLYYFILINVKCQQVDGYKNEKMQSIKFQKFVIDCAHFTVDGKQFVAGSRTQRHFHCYDLMEGRSMFVPIHHNIGQTRMDVRNSIFNQIINFLQI